MKLLTALALVILSHAPATASEANESAPYCEEAMALKQTTESENPAYDRVRLVGLCNHTEHSAETWQCVVRRMEGDGRRYHQAMTLCGVRR